MRLGSATVGGERREPKRAEVTGAAEPRAALEPEAVMSWTCPRCQQPVFFAEKVSSLGQNWHRFCLKCERCHNVLAAGGHAEHNGKPYCHKPCYAVLFGPQGIKIGGVGSYMEDLPRPPTTTTTMPLTAGSFSPPRSRTGLPQAKRARRSPTQVKMYAGETSLCPGCGNPVYFAEKVMSLGRNWHRPCLRCQRCRKTLTAGSHAEHDGFPYCHIPCYGYLFGPKGVNIGDVGCYIYDSIELKSD